MGSYVSKLPSWRLATALAMSIPQTVFGANACANTAGARVAKRPGRIFRIWQSCTDVLNSQWWCTKCSDCPDSVTFAQTAPLLWLHKATGGPHSSALQNLQRHSDGKFQIQQRVSENLPVSAQHQFEAQQFNAALPLKMHKIINPAITRLDNWKSCGLLMIWPGARQTGHGRMRHALIALLARWCLPQFRHHTCSCQNAALTSS